MAGLLNFVSFAVMFAWVCSLSALAQDRVALVIGNSAYSHAGHLPNPLNNAVTIAKTLKDIGFAVSVGTDLNHRGMRETIRSFDRKLKNAEIGVFYYSGLSLQVSGVNYLVPTDAKLEDATNIDFELVRLDRLLQSMEQAVTSSIVFLDASSENPLSRKLARTMGAKGARLGRGLAPIQLGPNTLISMSAAPGKVALDGMGRNSPYTAALAKHLKAPGADVHSILRRVRQDVAQATNGRQLPWENSSLMGDVRLTPKRSATDARGPNAGRANELALWNAVKDSQNTTVLQTYIERFPNSAFSKLAKARIAKLSSKSIAIACQSSNCSLVRVFFGTERKQGSSKERVRFTADRARRLQIGRAYVTVPRGTGRKRGQIPRPTLIEKWLLRVPAEGDPSKHFTIVKDGFRLFRNPNDFLAEIREHAKLAGNFKDHAFIFVHGYNVDFDEALYRTAQIAYDLGYDEPERHVSFGIPFLYSWPSGGETTDYAYDKESARFTVAYLKQFIELVAERSGAKKIHLVAHSMGNVPLLKALGEMSNAKWSSGATINQVVLAAPDMDVEEFDKLARAITPIAKSVTLYASSNDVAMLAARKIHRDRPRAGDVPSGGPVIIDNVYSIDISALSTDIFSIKHSDYADRRELLSDMNRLFVKQEQPPHKRNVNFLRRFRGDKEYWRYAD